jgi:hypothetical protein
MLGLKVALTNKSTYCKNDEKCLDLYRDHCSAFSSTAAAQVQDVLLRRNTSLTKVCQSTVLEVIEWVRDLLSKEQDVSIRQRIL